MSTSGARCVTVYDIEGYDERGHPRHKSNLEAIADQLDATGVDETLVNVLADVQTLCGLLIAVTQDKADRLVEWLKKNQTRAAVVIGKVTQREEAAILFRAD